MHKRIYFLVSFAVLHTGLTANADQFCSNDRYAPISKTQCYTAGTGAAIGASSGVYAAKKYGSASLIEEQNTKVAFAHDNPKVLAKTDILSPLSQVQDGDKITFLYQLSEAENRAHHISEMESAASSERASAVMHGALALTATKAEFDTHTDSNGQTHTTTRIVPDYAARAMHAALAANALSNAADYDSKADDARRGGPVPTYTFDKVLTQENGNRVAAETFISERQAAGSKVFKMTRLPAASYRIVVGLTKRARAGVAGVALGLGFALEEVTAGYAAEKIEESSFQLPINQFGND